MHVYPPCRSFGIAVANLFSPYSCWKHYQSLKRTQYLSQGELQKRQLKYPQNLYRHACETPYYINLRQQGAIPDCLHSLNDLRKLPLMTKKNYTVN